MKKLYLFLSMAFVSPVLFAQIYVTEVGAGNKDGSSWANAYEGIQLQQAINEAEAAPVKQVWVAKGTYNPTENLSTTGFLDDGTTPTTDRDKAFILKAGVEIYGGFAGTELPSFDLTTRNFILNETILSGDLGILGDVSDNAYHVVASRDDADGAILDGFTIRDGYGDDDLYMGIEGGFRIRRNIGAAIAYFSAKTLTFRNLVIKDNKTTNAGGAIYARAVGNDAKYDFTDVRFENNETVSYGGGVVYSVGDNGTSSINFTRCDFISNKGAGTTGGGAIFHNNYILNITNSIFEDNETTSYGGAIRLNNGTANIISTIFKDGSASTRGGGIYSTNAAILNLDGCTFDNNTSTTGGHYYLYSGTASVNNTSFQNGTSTGSGGAVFNFFGTLTISKSKFYSNTSAAGAAAIHSSSNSSTDFSSTSIYNSIFFKNISNGTGVSGVGAIYINTYSEGIVINSTFYQNASNKTIYGAISFNNAVNTRLTLINNIFHANKGAEKTSVDPDPETYDVISADVRRGTAAVQTYSYNLFQDVIASGSNRTVVMPHYLDGTNPQPLFASTTEGDYNFLWPIENSFAIDKGDDALYTSNVSDVATAKDFLGNDRLVGSSIDLGAIEWGIILPVQVSSFTANLVNGRTQLKWSVGTEDNVNRYEVERSQNGTDFTTVATVGANGAASYGTTDNSPALGINYYRLVTVDNDGARKAYDRVQTVTVATLASEGVSVYPNPATGGEVNVSLGNAAAGTYGYKALSITGSVVQQGSINYDGTSAVVSVGSLPAGVYVLQFSHGAQAKLIKQ